jgi:hypothetical protein
MNRGARRAAFVLILAAGAAASALPIAPARAEITPEARRVVERYLEATGGRAAFEAVRTVRMRATVRAFGLAGTTTAYLVRPDRRASDTRLGPFHIPEGYDGEKGWRVDPGGQVIVLDGKDLEDARGAAWFDHQRWLLPDQGGGRVVVAGHEEDSSGAYTVVEVTPPAGRPRSFWFHDGTGLIHREVTQRDQMTVIIEPSDYRDAGGRRVPFRSRQRIVDMPANDLTMVVDSIWVDQLIDPAVFQPPRAEADRVAWLKAPGRAVLPVRYAARHVWLRVSVNGHEPADFLFDTGASLTVIDSAYAVKIGLATEGESSSQGAGATGSARFSRIETIRVQAPDGDGVDFRNQRVGVLSINPFLAPFFWQDCAGVLGADFIASFVTEIDYDAATITLHDPKTFTYSGAGQAVPFTLAGNMPAIHMRLDGKYEGEFRVDVGSSATVDLHRPFVERHRLRELPGPRVAAAGGGFGGTFVNELTRMEKIEIGPFSWEQPMVSLSGATAGALASEDYAGNIGNRILERFRCTFDYERRQLHLEPSKRYAARDGLSRTGIQLTRTDGVVRAMQVLPGSAAARAGVREYDEILAIDGRPIGEWTLEKVSALFEGGEVGRSVSLEVRRDGRAKKLAMKLADVL